MDGKFVRGRPVATDSWAKTSPQSADDQVDPAHAARTGDRPRRRRAVRLYLPTASFEATNKSPRTRRAAFRQPGNAAAGAVRQLDPKATAKRNLAMWAYSAAGLEVASQTELLESGTSSAAREPGSAGREDAREVIRFHRRIQRERHTLKYGTDGVVVSRQRRDQKRLGLSRTTRAGDRLQVPAEQATTSIEESSSTSRMSSDAVRGASRLAPSSGTTVKRATLHNSTRFGASMCARAIGS